MMRSRSRFFRLGVLDIAVVASLSSCLDPAGVTVDSDIARFQVDNGSLVVANTSQAPLYYFAANREALALIDWSPCDSPSTCDGIAPGTTRRLPFASLAGYRAGAREAAVYHWHLVPGNRASGFLPDRIRQSIVPLTSVR